MTTGGSFSPGEEEPGIVWPCWELVMVPLEPELLPGDDEPGDDVPLPPELPELLLPGDDDPCLVVP